MTARRGSPAGTVAAAVFATCWLVYTLFWTPFILREHYPAIALAEHGSLNVEEYTAWSEDIFHGPAGGAWINNNPGASLLGAIPLRIARPLLEGLDHRPARTPPPALAALDSSTYSRAVEQGRERFFLSIAFLTVAFVMAPAGAAAASFISYRLVEGGLQWRSAAYAALLYAFGTPVFFRAGYLNHNQLVGHAGVIAFLLLYRPGIENLTGARSFLAGLLAGFALLCDFTGILVIATLGIYVLWRGGIRMAVPFAAGILPGLAGMVLYQWTAFGNPLRPSQHYMTPTAPTSQGYRGFDWPSAKLLWANFFDLRFGLYVYCPVLLAAFAAPFLRLRYRLPARETAIVFVYFVLFVLFCAANQYSWLQPSTGFRYLVPVVPPLFVLSASVLDRAPKLVQAALALLMVVENTALAMTHSNNPLEAVARVWASNGTLLSMRFLEAMGLISSAAAMSAALYAAVAVAAVAIWGLVIRRTGTGAASTEGL